MDARIEIVLALIGRDIRAKHESRALATHVRLSVSRFYDLFRHETGTVPARYIHMRRLEDAKGLLLNSHLSVKEIADRVGIQDMSHFVRDFQRQYGLSPRRFRREFITSSQVYHGAQEDSLTNRNFRQQIISQSKG